MTASNRAHGTAYPDATDWRERAACRDEDPELFFPVGLNAEARRQEAEAKAVCFRCPVRTDCLTWALNHGERYGVWGGSGEDERAGIERKRTTNRLTPADVEQIVALSAQGLSDRRISEQIGVHRTTVSTVLRTRGRPDRRGGGRSVTPELVERAAALRAEGLSWARIGMALGVSDTTARRAVNGERVAS